MRREQLNHMTTINVMIRAPCLRRHVLSFTSPQAIARRAFTQSALHAAKPRLRSSANTSNPLPRKPPTSPPPPNAVSALEPAATGPALTYPSAIRIYSRSAPRIALLGIIRLTPFVLITLWTLNVGSTILESDLPVAWPQLIQAAFALLPILVVVPWTSGYVARVLIQLPAEARRSPEALRKWVESKAVEEALVEIKTVRANGFSWATTQCRVRELRARKPTVFSQYNFERVVDRAREMEGRSLWQRLYALVSAPPRFFKIATEEGLKSIYVKEPWIWPALAKRIAAQSARSPAITEGEVTKALKR